MENKVFTLSDKLNTFFYFVFDLLRVVGIAL